MGNAEPSGHRSLPRFSGIATAMAVAMAVAMVIAPHATAHHSAAMYDSTRCLAARGSVESFSFISPHSLLTLRIGMPAGGQSTLSLQGTAAPQLRDYDPRWSARLLSNGMVVTAEFNPRRDGRLGGLLQDLTLPDGTVINAWRPATCPNALKYAAAHR